MRFPLVLFRILAALAVTAGVASAAKITEVKTYQSTLSVDAQGPLNLTMEANYDDAVLNAPLMVMMHQYSGTTDLFNQVRPNAQRLRDQGFFVITVAMRGREGSGGVRDSGGLEIHDIFDAAEAAKALYGGLIDPDNISVTGYSGGGGNVMSALTKFPDYFRSGSAFYGMSDYGHDPVNGWYQSGAGHRTAQLDIDIGNPNTGGALVASRYLARASNLASRNNPYSEIRFFINIDEFICPPINSTSYRDRALAAATFAGEFGNIIVHLGSPGLYQDFNGNGVNDPGEEQYWPHTTLTPDQQQSGLSWFVARLLDRSIAAPLLKNDGRLFVAGFVRTKPFSFFVGDGQNGAGTLLYGLSPEVKTFTFDLESPHPVVGKLVVDTADMAGRTVHVLRNGALAATFAGGGSYEVADVADGETIRLAVADAPAASEILFLSGIDKDNTVPWDFRVSAGRNAGVWSTIPVPSCWDTKGFGSYEYGWDSTAEYGEYKTTFQVPAGWGGQRVFLVFEGAMTDTEARINGLPAGGGVASGPPANERALDNRASAGMGQGGGIAVANGNLNLGTLSAVTLTCWVKPETGFAAMPDARFPRLMALGANANYDANAANGIYLSVFNSGANARTLQFKVNSDAGDGAIAGPGILNGSDWTFVAVTFDPALGSGNVKFYLGDRSGALGGPVSTVTYGAGSSMQLGANAFAYLLNRGSDRGRAFDGLGDDFRVFAGALSAAQLEAVRASGLDTGVAAPAPLYRWHFNHASTGTSVAPAAGSGGALSLLNSGGSAADLYSPIGDGVSSLTLANERALDNRASVGMGQGGGVAVANGNLNLGTLSAVTLTCWLRPEADFGAMPNARFARLMLLGANANYDADAANGVYLSLFHSGTNARTLQFKVNSDGGTGALASPGILNGSDWTFVAVTFDPALGSGNVKFYVGDRSGALGGAVSTVTYGAGASMQLGANAFAYLLNRGADRGRAFDGQGDDFRVFAGALSAAQLEAVRASGLGAGGSAPTPLYHWNFNHASTGTSVAPVTGSGGELTLLNSGGSAANLYSPIGDGVSAGLPSASTGVVWQGGFYEFSYDVTDQLNYGANNLLEVTVRKVSANASINHAERRADYWTFGGIYRPVYLEARPVSHIERLAVDAKADGQISVHTFLSGVAGPLTVAARVADLDGVPLGAEFTQTVAADASSVVLSASLPSPRQWSPEFPHLYRLTVELRDGPAVLHSRTETIGFRTIVLVPGSGFTVNGKKVLMRGVNRHDFWPTDGRTTSRAVSIADIELIKSMNMNAVRMSHYPPAKHFLEECDRLGLLVFNELAGWQSAYDDTVAPDLVRRMVIRDVNHPSIFAWGNGNEGGFNYNVTSHYALWDPQARPTLHSANWASELTGGVRTHHYALYNVFLGHLGAGKPVYMPTEIQHALFDGGGGAGLADHWEPMRTAPNGGGMFIWAFADEGIARDDRGGAIDVAGDAAPDGIVGPYREKEASYHTVKALWSPVQLTPPDPATFAGSLAVENRFDFTNLNQCAFTWQLGWFPDPADAPAVQASGFIVGASGGPFAGPPLAPGASGTLALGLPPTLSRYDALRVTARDPHGREIYTWTWSLRDAAQIRERLVKAAIPAAAPLVPGVNGGELSVTNGARTWRFDLATGRLNGVSVGGQAVSLSNGPRPVTGSWTTNGVTHGFDGADYLVTMNNVTSASNGFQWRLRPDGWLTLKYRYTLTGEQTWLGVTFDYPEANVTGMSWLGQGPYRVWKNRLEGQELAVHHKTANDAIAGYRWSGFPEFRGYHGRLHWARLDTTQRPITVTTGTPDLFLRVLTPHLPPSNLSWRTSVFPAFPAGNLSLLHAINPIGNKFEAATATAIGPSSAPTVATGLYEGEAAFYFGDLPAPGTDRDGNGLSDSWELQHFSTLGHDAEADVNGNGLPLMLENAFDLSPHESGVTSPRLPVIEPAPGSLAMLGFHMPELRWHEFRYVPEISDDLQAWFDEETFPEYFASATSLVGDEREVTVEPGPDWPGDDRAVFMRLRIWRR